MSKNLRIIVALLICITVLGCGRKQQKRERDISNADGMPLLSYLYFIPTMIEINEAYYQEHQHYPASKQDFLAFCQSHEQYQSFNSNFLDEMKYQLLDDGCPQIGIPMQTESNGTTQYLDIKLQNQKINVDEFPPQMQELMQQQIREALESIFQENTQSCP